MNNSNLHIKDFRKNMSIVTSCGYYANGVFRDLVSLGVYSMAQNSVKRYKPTGRLAEIDENKYEDMYMATMSNYTAHKSKEERLKIGLAFSNMLADLILYSFTTQTEAVSELFEEFSSSGELGQFFTPKDIVIMMQKIAGAEKNDLEKYSFENPYWYSDPSCGGGRTLIYPALEIDKEYRERLAFHGIDLDKTCVEMTTLNLAIFNLRGYVIHGNALSLETYGGYATVPTDGMVADIIPLTREQARRAISFSIGAKPAKEKEDEKEKVCAEIAQATTPAAIPETVKTPPAEIKQLELF